MNCVVPLFVVSALVAGSTLATNASNHRVTFKNFQHDPFENAEDRLRETLSSLLPNKTVVFENLTNSEVSWHIKEIQELQGCPLEQIQQLEKVIKGPGTANTFSRLFKMIIQQYFKLEAVEVEYLGPCASTKQKRSKIMSPLYSTYIYSTTEPLPPTTTTELPPTTLPVTSPDAIQPETTTNSLDSTGPTSTEDFFGGAFTDAKISSSGYLNLPSIFGTSFNATPLANSNTTSSLETSTSSQELSTTTVVSVNLNSTTSPNTINNNTQTSPPQPITSTFPSSNLSQTTPTLGLQTLTSNNTNTLYASSSTELAYELTTTTSPATPLGTPNQLTEHSQPLTPSPYYGKYVGLVTAFLIFVAFLICSRAYNRNGMYELQTE